MADSPSTRESSASVLRARIWYARAAYLLVGLKLLTSVFLSEDDGFQSAYAMLPKIVDTLILLMGIIGVMVAPSTKRKWRVVGFSLTLLAFATVSQALAGRSFLEAYLTLAKLLAPLLLLSGCLLNNVAATSGGFGARALVWWVLFLVVLGLAFVEPSFRNGQDWLPAYFSGTHTAAYVSVFAIALAAIIKREKWWRDSLSLPGAILIFMVIFGWGVRTAMAGAVIAALYVLINRATPKQRIFLGVQATLVSLLVMLVAVFSGWITALSLEEFSSGRTSVWVSRMGEIVTRPLLEMLLGTGVGSNLTYSEVWWWELKDSHNDFLAILYEQGVVGLAAALALLVSVYRLGRSNVAWNAVWLMYLASSVLSNGVMFRPTASCVFALAALAAYRAARVARK